MTTNTTRFDTLYERMGGDGAVLELSGVLETRLRNTRVSIAASEGIHIDDNKRPTSKGIGMLIVQQTANRALQSYGRVISRVELYRDAEGEVVANYTGRADLFNSISGGLNHGYPEREFIVPEQSAQIALNSALVAVETALDQHDAAQAIA